MKYFILCVVIYSLCSSSCQAKSSVVDTLPNNSRALRPKGILDTLPFAGNVHNYEKLIELMQLNNLKISSDEYFRIWFEYGGSLFGTSIVIFSDKDGWVGYRYVFKVIETKPGDYGDSIIAINFRSEMKKTVSGNHSFQKKIDSINIFELKQPEVDCVAEPNVIMIEALKKGVYRNLPYLCPVEGEMDQKELEKLESLKKLILNEFGFGVDLASASQFYNRRE